MRLIISKLNKHLFTVENYISSTSLKELESKPSQNKWSKKEILGHLIDSGINNLQRFTEIQFLESPYELRNYHQSNLVKSNFYQEAQIEEILQFWLSINRRIIFVISNISKDLYQKKIILPSKEIINLSFLIDDYEVHLEYHINQIIN